MTLQNLWPLAFLSLIPLIVLLYLLRQRAKDQIFSSDMLWQEVYKNLEARTPFEKLKKNILMYLQILLLLLLILALAAPVWKRGGEVQQNLILVIDTSASMFFQHDGDGTRFDYSIREAEKAVENADGAIVTIISCDSDASIVYQGSDALKIKSRLRQLSATDAAGTLDAAVPLVNSVASSLDNVSILCYTDTEFASGEMKRTNEDASLSVISAYSDGENCSLNQISYATDDNGTTVLCSVTNHGAQDNRQDVSLYVDNEIVSVLEVETEAGGSSTVYFDPVKMNTDGSTVIKAELSDQDALPQDNVQQLAVTSGTEKRVLLLSDGNVFLEKSLGLNEGVEVYKSDNPSVLAQADDVYDLYVFDGDILKDAGQDDVSDKNKVLKWLANIPDNAALLFLNQSEDIGGLGGIVLDGKTENVVLSFADTPVTRYVTDFSFGITAAYRYLLPEWGRPVIRDAEGGVCGYYGDQPGVENTSSQMTAVLGFDIHNSDLALKTEFPIFMSQLTDALLKNNTNVAEVKNFPTALESDVAEEKAVPGEENGDGSRRKTGGQSLRNFLLILALILLAVEWFVYVWQVHTSKKRQYLSVRLFVCLTVILAASGLSVTVHQKEAQTVFLVDVSDSMSGNITNIEQYLQNTIARMPAKNSKAVVVFGKNTAVDSFMTERSSFSEFTAQPVTSATNIENAVETACALFDEDVAKQLVLLTDGSENEGSLSLSAATVKNHDVELSVIEMEDSIGSSDEAYVSDLSLPGVIHIGDHYNVSVTVKSNVETDARLLLYAGRSLKEQQDVHLTIGTNQFVFEDTAKEETIAQYKAVLESDKDTISVNNTYVAFSEIEAKPRILLVEGRQGEAEEFEKLLNAIGVSYDCVSPSGVPATVAQLNNYKAVITLDVYYDDLRRGFAGALDSYVKDYAGGYICIGGDNSYALGNYRGTELEDILPVYMDMQGQKEIPKMAMAMVIDQSGSMSSPAADDTSMTCLGLAKQAAMAGSSQLRESDEIGVLAFDDKYNWVVPMRTADDMEKIESQIESIAGGGGTSIYPAFEEAYRALLKSDARLKHIILLTDGQDGFHEYDDLIKKVNAADITVSTVAVGEDADQETLEWIAGECGGRYYYTDMNNATPRIFAQEVYLAADTYLVNGEFYPSVTSQNEILTDVFDEGIPAMLGYVATTPKQTADVLLTSQKGDPVLSTWQYGLGRSVAWASDCTNEWTAAYASWENYPLLWSNILNYVIADTSLGEDSLEVAKSGTETAVTYDTDEYSADTKVNAVITDEDGDVQEITLEAVKPGTFQGKLDADKIGVYSVNVRKYEGDRLVQSYNTAYASQYSAEYQFSDVWTDLSSYTAQCGGRLITMDNDVWKADLRAVANSTPITVPLLMLAIFLWLADVTVRRLSVDIAAGIRRVGSKILSVFVPFESKLEQCLRRAEKPQTKERKREKPAKAKKQASRRLDAAVEMLDTDQLLKKKRDRDSGT